MPIRGSPGKHGRLIVEFTVMFPPDNFADEASMAMLEGLLPARPDLPPPREDDDVHPGEFELQELDDMSDGGSDMSGQYSGNPMPGNHTHAHNHPSATRHMSMSDSMHMNSGRNSLTSIPSSDMLSDMDSYHYNHRGSLVSHQQPDCQAQ